ncbi:diacylglycerol kinase [Alteribacillus persepolensis]|uniref:Diacylglycerol kinase n=1 Tax=Alteribacillus persepolensis TaxID=568899 RepID=A0A1G8F502_9BACI|nr:diacylglycerol kinase [Alteribacillus persepolensis]SDH77182.1 diacylglycerol kinase [Alteribacillus persepolensis]
MRRARVIYNPTSGREQMKKQLPYILDRLETSGYETSAHMTKREGDAKEEAKRAGLAGFEVVIAAGGDGTIFEVVNGLAKLEERPKLGLIPAGTTNDLARALGISGYSIEKICDVLCGEKSSWIDIGKVNHQYFINIAAGGKLTELTYDTPSKLKTMMGQFAYYVKGVEKLGSLKPKNVRIEYDGKLFEGDIMMFLIANTNSVGGFEKLLPNAKYNDGMFDMIIIKKTNVPELVRIGTQALQGEHLHHEKVLYVQANRIKIQVDGDMQLNLDGEYGGKLPAEFVNLHHHVEMLCP